MSRNSKARRATKQRRQKRRASAHGGSGGARRPIGHPSQPTRSPTDDVPSGRRRDRSTSQPGKPTTQPAESPPPVDKPTGQQGAPTSRPTESSLPSDEAVERLMAAVAPAHADNPDADVADRLRRLCDLDDAYPNLVERCLCRLLDRNVGRAWQKGWQPAELVAYARRRVAAPVVPFVSDAMAHEHGRYATATVDPRWQAQLDEVETRPWWEPSRSRLDQAAQRYDMSRWSALRAMLAATGLLMTLPRLQRLLPLPGHGTRPGGSRQTGGADRKILDRIRGLLGKAEATDYPDEADALSVKAQALMTKYSLDLAAVAADDGWAEPLNGPAARRIWLAAPYGSAKSHLVATVAQANRCRAVTDGAHGFVTIVGTESDLQLVELLVTSLLVQATREMLRAGSRRSTFGTSTTRSYRHAFLISYAIRIGQRLRTAAQTTQAAAGAADRLLPVLARREERVAALAAELFPHTVARRVSVSNRAGWAHGRAAADLARLDPRRGLRSG